MIGRSAEHTYRLRHFGRKSSKFAQKRGCQFYWHPAGSIQSGIPEDASPS
jgi:hypothetical protein